jgi:cytochrome d ubiquinol oxidase subunit II
LLWVALGVALVSVATPLASESVRDKWFDFPRTLGLMLLPLATFAAWLWVWASLGKSDWKPFAGTVAIFALAFAGLAYSVFPYVVLGWLTVWDAAAHPSALKVMLAGVIVVLPFLVGYTVFAYRVFRGKAKAGLYGH